MPPPRGTPLSKKRRSQITRLPCVEIWFKTLNDGGRLVTLFKNGY
jgi:hypothetical protein